MLESILLPTVFAVFAFDVFFFALMGLVLSYHWTRYGVRKNAVKKIQRLYFGIGGALLIVMLSILFTLTQ